MARGLGAALHELALGLVHLLGFVDVAGQAGLMLAALLVEGLVQGLLGLVGLLEGIVAALVRALLHGVGLAEIGLMVAGLAVDLGMG